MSTGTQIVWSQFYFVWILCSISFTPLSSDKGELPNSYGGTLTNWSYDIHGMRLRLKCCIPAENPKITTSERSGEGGSGRIQITREYGGWKYVSRRRNQVNNLVKKGVPEEAIFCVPCSEFLFTKRLIALIINKNLCLRCDLIYSSKSGPQWKR